MAVGECGSERTGDSEGALTVDSHVSSDSLGFVCVAPATSALKSASSKERARDLVIRDSVRYTLTGFDASVLAR